MVLSVQVYKKKKKKIIRSFKLSGFKIEISSNIKVANVLDVTLNLSDNSCRLFLKTDPYPSYINVNFNHPNSIIKQVPKAVNTRISRLSSNKNIFHESSKMYIKALKNSGFKEESSGTAKSTPRCRGGHNSFPRIAPIYPWYVTYIAVCQAGRYQLPFLVLKSRAENA